MILNLFNMEFSLERSLEILERTPVVLQQLLGGLHEDWVRPNEGPETFSPYDVLGHLIHGERTDWMARTRIILDEGISRTFDPYDRFAQNRESQGKNTAELLEEFAGLRKQGLNLLRSLQLEENDLDREGQHPVLGKVTLRNLLATWVVHDLTHIAQITRVMAKQYKAAIGPWQEFFRILKF